MTRSNSIAVHVFFWSIWILATLGINLALSKPSPLLVSLPNYLISIALFYAIYGLVYKPFLKKDKKIIFAIPLIFLLFSVFHLTRVYIIENLLLLNNSITYKPGYFNNDLVANSLSYFVQYSLFSFGYWFAISALQRQRRIAELTEENHTLERKQLSTEINFLKAQINPHFLYNTLNALYAQAQPHSEQLADNILKLSEIMRYSLESVDNEKGTVQLQSELEHLKNLIDIHQLRFSNGLNIDYKVTGIVNGHQVPPLSLITAVENAFKYGDLKTPQHPLRIHVNVATDEISFYCMNKKKRGSIEFSHGIGINNMKKRLNIAFLNKYEIKTKNEADYYTFELTIKN